MANADRTRKLIVRTALVTSSTFATIIGTQNLAMLDTQQFGQNRQDALVNLAADGQLPSDSIVIDRAAPNGEIVRGAPNIIVLRPAGSTTALSNALSGTNSDFQPPVPAQVTVPRPSIIQQLLAARSRSSR